MCETHFVAELWVEARIWLGKSTTAELNLKTSALVSRFISVDLIKYLDQKRKEKETKKKEKKQGRVDLFGLQF